MGYGLCRGNDISGAKRYELSNHLGNVLAVITDRKWSVDAGAFDASGVLTSTTADGTVDYYEPSVVSYSDYYPYGMLMDNRNGNDDYRYSFQGQEHDDEVKGKGNSIGYEARIYDPRVGRWLSRDPLASKQPDQSPYKAMLNNPIFWADPNGETEYQTVIFTNEKTGEMTKFYVSKSSELMTDGEVKVSQHLLVAPRQNYYDYRHVTRINLTTDGKIIVTEATEILYDNGVKHEERVGIDFLMGTQAKAGDIYDPGDDHEQAGGFYMTSASGEGTKFHSKNADYVGNIDDLISLTSTYRPSGKFKVNNKGFDNQQAWDGIQDIMEYLPKVLESGDKVKGLIENIDKLIDGVSKELSSDRVPGNENTLSNEVTVTDDGNGGKIRNVRKATIQERRDGDTLKVQTPSKVKN